MPRQTFDVRDAPTIVDGNGPEVKVLVPTGALGAGVRPADVRR